MIKLESHRRVRVGDDLKQTTVIMMCIVEDGHPHLAPHPVHGDDGSLVRVKVDEAIASWLPGELVGHHLDADHASLPHHGDRILREKIITLKPNLELEYSPCALKVVHMFCHSIVAAALLT